MCAVRGIDGGEREGKGDLKPINMRLSVSLQVVSRLGPPAIAALP